jgi:uncharacterized protein YkwD
LAVVVGALAPVVASARAVVARAAPPCPGADLRPGPGNVAAVGAATVCLINHVRDSYHLGALRANRYLQRAAAGQVRQMVRLNYFADVRPSGHAAGVLIVSSRHGAHAASLATGQNIGWGTGHEATAASIVGAWMASPPHRALILARAFHDVGVGVAARLPTAVGKGKQGAVYAVKFAARAA